MSCRPRVRRQPSRFTLVAHPVSYSRNAIVSAHPLRRDRTVPTGHRRELHWEIRI